jgi:hypothetical protein
LKPVVLPNQGWRSQACWPRSWREGRRSCRDRPAGWRAANRISSSDRIG